MDAICPKCGERKALTKHHVYPKRYKAFSRRKVYVWLCRDCHDELEILINGIESVMPKLPMHEYTYKQIVNKFLD